MGLSLVGETEIKTIMIQVSNRVNYMVQSDYIWYDISFILLVTNY